MSFAADRVQSGIDHLCKSDAVMRDLIAQIGPFQMRLEKGRFPALVRSIISQQISGSAARSIRRRLEQLFAPAKITPEALARLSPAQLRSAGISPQKARYLLDLATKVATGEV